ncbi:MAG: hypothetical protein ACRD2O_18375, partial [Terriglobia bacterium]
TYRDPERARLGSLMVNLRVNGCIVASDLSVPPLDGTGGPKVEIFEVDTNLHPGMSGAPIVSPRAEVVGIVSRGFVRYRPNLGLDETGYTAAIRVQHLRALLGTVPQGEKSGLRYPLLIYKQTLRFALQ